MDQLFYTLQRSMAVNQSNNQVFQPFGPCVWNTTTPYSDIPEGAFYSALEIHDSLNLATAY